VSRRSPASGVFEHRIEIRPLEFHSGQDVIAGAVDNPVEVGDAVSDESFAEGFDDGDAAADAGLVIKVCPVVPGGREELFPVFGEQGLVRRNDRFAEFQRG